jgi:hypothetical protein
MSQVIPSTDPSIDREIAKIKGSRATRILLVLTGLLALTAAFIVISYLMLSDQSWARMSPPPITAKDLAPLVAD